MEFQDAYCEDCDWGVTLPRENAEHAKRVHEDETGHTTFLGEPEES